MHIVTLFRTYVLDRTTSIDFEKGSLSIRGKASLLLPKNFELEAPLSKLRKVFVSDKKIRAKGIIIDICWCLGASGDFGTVVLDFISGAECKRQERFEIWHEFFGKRLNYSDDLFKPIKPSVTPLIKASLELLKRILK
jgi:hypothetical protein